MYRSISRNQWHTRFVYRFTVSRFYRFHQFISEDTSLLLFIQKWKLISRNQRICWRLSCNWESKDQTIYHPFLKRRFKKSKSIKIVSNQVILSIDKEKRLKSYLGKSFSLNFRHPFYSKLKDVGNSGWEIFYLRLYFSWYLPARTSKVIKPNRFCHYVQKGHGFRENLVSVIDSTFLNCWSIVTCGCVFSVYYLTYTKKQQCPGRVPLYIVKIMKNR